MTVEESDDIVMKQGYGYGSALGLQFLGVFVCLFLAMISYCM